ncbi:hypothetical protein CDIK_3520, partial [Cucumispora dikerogammari]
MLSQNIITLYNTKCEPQNYQEIQNKSDDMNCKFEYKIYSDEKNIEILITFNDSFIVENHESIEKEIIKSLQITWFGASEEEKQLIFPQNQVTAKYTKKVSQTELEMKCTKVENKP